MSKKSIGLRRKVYRKLSRLCEQEILVQILSKNYKEVFYEKNIIAYNYNIKQYHVIDSIKYKKFLGYTSIYSSIDTDINNKPYNKINIEFYTSSIIEHSIWLYERYKNIYNNISFNIILNSVIKMVVIHEVRHSYQYMYNDIEKNGDCAEVDADMYALIMMAKNISLKELSIVFNTDIIRRLI